MPVGFASLIYVFAFLAVVILAQTLASLLFSTGDRSRRINRRLELLDAGLSHEAVYSKLIRKHSARGEGDWFNLLDRLETLCGQAGIKISSFRLLAILVGVTGGFWLFGLAIIGMRGGDVVRDGVPALLGAALLSVLLAVWWIGRLRTARLKLIDQQLPLALDVVTRALKAGHPAISAVQLAASEMGDPIGSEFGLIVDETTYGAEFREALSNFARRTGSTEAHYFAVAVSIQTETGGNLAEILEGLTRVMRGRATLVKRVKALSSEGMASAYILSALPAMLISFVLVTNPQMYTSKFSDPIFWPSVTAIGVLYLCGWIAIRRIMNFKY